MIYDYTTNNYEGVFGLQSGILENNRTKLTNFSCFLYFVVVSYVNACYM